MKKFLIALLLMPAIAYAGVKGYAWYKVKTAMDEVVLAMTPFANVTYGGIGTTLTGSISVHDLDIYSPMMQLDLSIDEMRVTAPSLRTLLNMEDELKSQRMPEEIGLHLVHARIPTSTIDNLKQMSPPSELDEYFARLSTLGCGDVETIDTAELIEMGYNELDLSVSMKMRRNAVSKYTDMRVEAEWHGGGSVLVDAQIPGSGTFNDVMGTGGMPRFSVDIENAAYNDRAIAYCAEKSGQDAEGFVASHLELLKARLNDSGIYLNDALYEAYHDYIAKGENITVSMSPDDPSLLQHIGMYPPTDVLTILGVELSVGGRLVDYEVNWDQQKFQDAVAGRIPLPGAPAADTPMAAASPNASEPEARQHGYVDIDKAELAGFAESLVRLETVTGRLLEGRIKAVENNTVWLHVRVRGGAATLPILLGDITSAKVFM